MSFEVLPLSCAAFGAEAPEAPEACARTSSDIAKYQWPRLEFERFGASFPTLRHVLQLCIDLGRQALNHLFSSNPPGPLFNGNHFCFVVGQNDFLVAYLSIVPTRVIARTVSKGNVRTASTTKIEHLDVDCLCTMMYYKKISIQWCTYHKKVSGLTTYNWWWISGHPNQSPSPGPSCCWAVVVWLPRICTELHRICWGLGYGFVPFIDWVNWVLKKSSHLKTGRNLRQYLSRKVLKVAAAGCVCSKHIFWW